jgi:glucose-1-phosphatase
MPRSPIKLVLFDMDDVFCAYDWHRRIRLLARVGGLPEAQVRAAIWDSGFEDASDRGEIDAVTYLAGFGMRAGVSLSRSSWAGLRRAAMTTDPGMLALAHALKRDVAVALLTNNGHLTFETMPELFPEMVPLFGERLTVSAMFGTHKPDPMVFVRALERLGFAVGETMFVDDKPENADGAARAGLVGHHFTGIERLRAHLDELGVSV